MGVNRTSSLVVRVSVLDADGVVVRRLRLRLDARLRASVVVDSLLRRMLAERRHGSSVRIDTVPDQLTLVLLCCGIDARAVTP